MDIKSAIKRVSSKFKYTSDDSVIFDRWRIMDEDNDGFLRGDCEDFSLTAIWYACNKSWKKFLWDAVITMKYRLHFVKTKDGGHHAVGSFGNLYFDNFSKKALEKQEFFEKTGHKYVVVLPMFLFGLNFLAGHITRKKQ